MQLYQIEIVRFLPKLQKASWSNNCRLLTKMGFRHYWNREGEAAACYKAISIDEVYQAAAYFVFPDATMGKISRIL